MRPPDAPSSRHSVGHIVASGEALSLLVVVPTPFILDGHPVVLHLAAPNPVFACPEEDHEALMSVTGDWAYIPASSNAIGDEDRRGILNRSGSDGGSDQTQGGSLVERTTRSTLLLHR